MRVVITGANGFVGRPLVSGLAAAGYDIVACLRRPDTATFPSGIRVVEGCEMEAQTDWGRALAGADAVVHLAALAHEVHSTSGGEAYRRVNVEGTRGLVAAATRHRIGRFVFVSSAKVMGDGTLGPMRAWTEDDEPRPEDDYGRTKLEAERIVLAAPVGPVVLRPPVVYGPGLKANLLRLLQAVDRGRPLPLRAIRNARSMIYVGNLVDAIERCLWHPAAAGGTFFVEDGETLSTAELADRMGRHLGRPARLLPIPPRILLAGGGLLGHRRDVERVISSLTVDSTLVRKRLEWRPPFTLDEGLVETIRWYRANQRAK